jgi:hypothetical protein
LSHEQRALTCGHELGHYWLELRGQAKPRSPAELTWDEALCDAIGESIVAPAPAVALAAAAFGDDFERAGAAMRAPAWLVYHHARLAAGMGQP